MNISICKQLSYIIFNFPGIRTARFLGTQACTQNCRWAHLPTILIPLPTSQNRILIFHRCTYYVRPWPQSQYSFGRIQCLENIFHTNYPDLLLSTLLKWNMSCFHFNWNLKSFFWVQHIVYVYTIQISN